MKEFLYKETPLGKPLVVYLKNQNKPKRLISLKI